MSWRATVLVAACVTLLACAQSGEGGDFDEFGGGGSSSSGDGGTSIGGKADTGGTGASSGAGGETGEGGEGPDCDPPEHLCGGICSGNSPETGCYQSVTCAACPQVTHGTASCAADGTCDFNCSPPYTKQNSICACPSQCCSNAECGGTATCENGTCVTPQSCDTPTCLIVCVLNGFTGGICIGDNCTCF